LSVGICHNTVYHKGKHLECPYAAVTCEIKVFQNYFSLSRRPSETILFRMVKISLKLFRELFQSNFISHVSTMF